MAETMLSPTALARIERDLDQLIFPAPETIRALLAEIRRTRGADANAARYGRALARIDSIIHHATEETT